MDETPLKINIPVPPAGWNDEGDKKKSKKWASPSSPELSAAEKAEIVATARRISELSGSGKGEVATNNPATLSARPHVADVGWREELRKRSSSARFWLLVTIALYGSLVVVMFLVTFFKVSEEDIARALGGFFPQRWVQPIFIGLPLLIGGWMILRIRRMRPLAPTMKCFCPHCENYIPATVAWVCGFCGKKHKIANRFCFLHKCRECGSAPRAYRCHHCKQCIFLDASRDERHCAVKWEPPLGQETEAAITARFNHDKLQLECARKLENEAALLARAKTERRLAESKADKEPRVPKGLREIEKEKFDQEWDLQMAKTEIYQAQEAIIKAEPDPEKREQLMEVLVFMKERNALT